MCWTQFDDNLGTSKIKVKRIQSSIGSEKTLVTAHQDTTDIVQGCNISVGPRGEVAVAWYQAKPTDSFTQGRIRISRSYDGRESWTSPLTVAFLTKIPPCSDGFYGKYERDMKEMREDMAKIMSMIRQNPQLAQIKHTVLMKKRTQ